MHVQDEFLRIACRMFWSHFRGNLAAKSGHCDSFIHARMEKYDLWRKPKGLKYRHTAAWYILEACVGALQQGTGRWPEYQVHAIPSTKPFEAVHYIQAGRDWSGVGSGVRSYVLLCSCWTIAKDALAERDSRMPAGSRLH